MEKKRGFLAGIAKAFSSSIGSATSLAGAGWQSLIREPFAGAWQRNRERTNQDILSYSPVFACITLIASDIAKLPINPIKLTQSGIWKKVAEKDLARLMARPNKHQNRIQFIEQWITSKLCTGNTYVLIVRGGKNGAVSQLKILDPYKVQVLIADDGTVFYELGESDVNDIKQAVIVPESEIIHDRFNCLLHPYIGMSPIFACSTAAQQGLSIQDSSRNFFENGSQMSGFLTAPGAIDDATAERLKKHWEQNYSGVDNAGKVAVAGDGLKFESRSMAAADSQLVEQLGWTARTVCSVFHVPAFKIGEGEMPPYNNIQALNQQYYSQCLQILIESIEMCLDIGIGLEEDEGIEFDVELGLLRMDSMTQMEVLSKGNTNGILKPDESRARLNLEPVDGGDAVYMQEQNYSLAALSKRDGREDLWETTPAPAKAPAPEPKEDDEEPEVDVKAMIRKALERIDG